MRAKPIITTSKLPSTPTIRTRNPLETNKTALAVMTQSIPKTPLGKRLMELREKIREAGAPLLSWEEIEREIFERRGESR